MRKWLSGRASPCQGEGRGFESRLPLHIIMVDVVKWLRHRIVAPAFVGSTPIIHPKYWDIAKSVRQRTLTPSFAGSSPAIPAILTY